MSDYIKREDAENIMLGSCDESALWKLRRLPSADVEPVRPHGKWHKEMPHENLYKCSVCNKACFAETWGNNIELDVALYDYCPNCGARMDGEEE